jgi:hypothetical protein
VKCTRWSVKDVPERFVKDVMGLDTFRPVLEPAVNLRLSATDVNFADTPMLKNIYLAAPGGVRYFPRKASAARGPLPVLKRAQNMMY